MRGKVRITVWSDYVCPFCYLEEPVLERLRREYTVDVEWRAFELRPEPVPTLDPNGEYLHTVWNRVVYPMARERGMTLRLPPVQPRSRKALELAEFARANGKFDDTHRALFRAFFEEGKDLGDVHILLEITDAVGLDRNEARAALARGSYSERVTQDQRHAQELRIAAVPAMLVGPTDQPLAKAELISGAHSYEIVRSAVERALRRA